MRFSETLKLTAPELVVSKRHEAWADRDRPYSTAALELAAQELAKPPREREGTVSASSLGECLRYQQFIFLGMPKLPFNAKSMAKMQNGSFMHLRWQMEGLTEGWLKRAEVPVHSDEHRLIGTMDGELWDDSILELKSINANGFRGIATFGPLVPHLFQMATYMLCTTHEKGVFIYENKDTQEYTEVVVSRGELPLNDARLQAQALWRAIEGKNLFEPREKCMDMVGWKYHSCPFRDRCLTIYTWAEAGG